MGQRGHGSTTCSWYRWVITPRRPCGSPETEGASGTDRPRRTHFTVDPSGCAVLVEARSNVGGVSFGTTDVSGCLEVVRTDGHVDPHDGPCARLSVPLESLTSGNALYDAELQQRLAAWRFPVVTVELTEAQLLGGEDYVVSGLVTLHGVTAVLHGAVSLSFPEPRAVLVRGEQVVDVSEFGIDVPSVLMLRIYPEVKVSLQLLARQDPPVGAEP
jgi:polyisoprenoid-binding protein YceI